MDLPLLRVDDAACRRFAVALELIGKRWNGAVLLAVARGAERFTQVLRAVPGLSDRMLAARLKELELHGLVVRTVVPTTPVQVRYAVSARGSKLLSALEPLAEVGREIERDGAAAG